MLPNVHLKGLNGIRAIAAIGVVVSHIGGGLKEFGFSFSRTNDLGAYGVTIFFSLSGFLITYLLLIEKAKEGHINIRAFYIRRVLRIWPLYYFYLLLAVISIWFYIPEKLPGGVFYYIALCANIPFIFQFPLPFLAHYWSLGVEEQFYLFWPWVVRKTRNLFRFLIIFILVFIAVKFAVRYLDEVSSWHWPYQALHTTRFDCMAIGAAGAVLFFRKNMIFFKIAFSIIAQLVSWGSLGLLAVNGFHVASVIDSEIIAMITVILIVNVSANPRSIIDLEKPLFDFLGKISYGIYVYHPLIIFFAAKLIGGIMNNFNDTVKLIFIFSIILTISILAAYISHEFFEKRFLALKAKFSPVKTVDTMKGEE